MKMKQPKPHYPPPIVESEDTIYFDTKEGRKQMKKDRVRTDNDIKIFVLGKDRKTRFLTTFPNDTDIIEVYEQCGKWSENREASILICFPSGREKLIRYNRRKRRKRCKLN